MINEPRFVTVKHTIQTQGEKLILIAQLNLLFSLIFQKRIVHVKKIAQSVWIIVATPHVSLFFCHNFTFVLTKEGPLRDVFHSKHAPHYDIILFNSAYLTGVIFIVFWLYQKVLALVFVASTKRMTFIIAKDFVYAIFSSHLGHYHATGRLANLFLISWIYQFLIPFVARTFFWILAAILTCTERCTFYFFLVFKYIFVNSAVLIDVLI